MGTKVRHLSDLSLKTLEGQIEALPFKVEIKNINFVGGKWYAHFTLLDKDSMVVSEFPSKEDKAPPVKKTKKTRTRKKTN